MPPGPCLPPGSSLPPTTQIAHLRSERDILRLLDSPLLTRLHGVAQDERCVFFVLEYAPGTAAE